MKRSSRLQPVRDIADRKEQAKSLDYARRQRQYDEACNKLEELQTYQAEYAASLHQRQGASLDVSRMHENRLFMLRLSDVVRLQSETVDKLRGELDGARQQWLASRQRSRSLGSLADSYRRQERAEAERREQIATDDLTTQRFVWNALHHSDLA